MSRSGGILAPVAAALLLCGCSTFARQLAHIAPPPPPPPAAPAAAPVAVKPPPPAIDPPPPAPKPRACVPKTFPRAPKYPDTDAALLDAGGAADRYQLMAAGRVLRSLRLAELEKIVEGCR
jgi:hypothetical protein